MFSVYSVEVLDGGPKAKADLTAEKYARDWAIPQFYFHLMAAYAILRGQGVPLGKIDYVAHMLPFLREGTATQA